MFVDQVAHLVLFLTDVAVIEVGTPTSFFVQKFLLDVIHDLRVVMLFLLLDLDRRLLLLLLYFELDCVFATLRLSAHLVSL